jgi:hypothetical protein
VTQKLAKYVSLVFHPIFVPIYGVFAIATFHLVVASKLNAQPKALLLSMYCVLLSILPLLGVMFLLNKYKIEELSSISLSERRMAAWALCLIYALEFWFLDNYFFHSFLRLFVLALCMSSGVLAILSSFKKVSFHVFGWSGLLVLMYVLGVKNSPTFIYLILAVLLVTGLVASARLTLKAHTKQEVYLGFIFGLICNIAVYLFFDGRV